MVERYQNDGRQTTAFGPEPITTFSGVGIGVSEQEVVEHFRYDVITPPTSKYLKHGNYVVLSPQAAHRIV